MARTLETSRKRSSARSAGTAGRRQALTSIGLIGLAALINQATVSAETTFGPQRIIQQPDADGAASVFAADLDGDGDTDILSASNDDDKIAWYENEDGMGTFGLQQTITTSALGAISVFAADLDGDGDQDVLSASNDDNKIAWYENADGMGAFGPQRVITTSALHARSVFAADLDGDGDVDVLSASGGDAAIAWYENTDGMGAFGPQQVISTLGDGAGSVFAADLDGDGDIDVLSASGGEFIVWYENTDGMGAFGGGRIFARLNGATSVFAQDLDGDGDQDVVSTSSGDKRIRWYENTDGRGTFRQQQSISVTTGPISGPVTVFAADLDSDGDHDLLSAFGFFGGSTTVWYENTDGFGAFGPQQTITTAANGVNSVFATDLDGDGDQDVLTAAVLDDMIAWYENTDGIGAFGPQRAITRLSASGALSVVAADLDGDGDQDVLSASFDDNKIAWYENTDGMGAFGPQQVITTSALRAQSVFAADINGDGHLDVLSGSAYFGDGKVAWYENLDGMGGFGPERVITMSAMGVLSVFAADLNGRGYMDVLSASFVDNKIAWHRNTDGFGNFGLHRVITDSAEDAASVFAADLDGDGDQDVLSASHGLIAWYENRDGRGSFGLQLVIMNRAAKATSVSAADLDGDGDQDVLSSSASPGKISWYENTDGMGAFGSQKVITNFPDGAASIFPVDLDGDGDQDVLSASRDDNKIAWYENIDGLGTFGPQRVITTLASDARSVYAADLDGDGDMDVLSASFEDDKIAWYENLPLNMSIRRQAKWPLYE